MALSSLSPGPCAPKNARFQPSVQLPSPLHLSFRLSARKTSKGAQDFQEHSLGGPCTGPGLPSRQKVTLLKS